MFKQKQKKALIFLSILFIFVFGILMTNFVFAQTVDLGVNEVGDATGLSTTDPRIIVGRIIQYSLGFLGVIAIGLILYAGFLYMTAGGEEDKVGKAKKYIINAIIGLVIILSAYSITSYLVNKLTSATGYTGTGTEYSDNGNVLPRDYNVFGSTILRSTITPIGDVEIYNFAIKVNFNYALTQAVIDNIEEAISVEKVLDNGNAEPADISYNSLSSNKQINIISNGSCDAACSSTSCFEKNTTYRITLNPSIIESIKLDSSNNNLQLKCDDGLSVCTAEIKTGNLCDSTPPFVSVLEPPYNAPICQGYDTTVAIYGEDNGGLSEIAYTVDGDYTDVTEDNKFIVTGANTYTAYFGWEDSSTFDVGKYVLSAFVSDVADNQALKQQQIRIVPNECCDSTGEIDCNNANPACPSCTGPCESDDDCVGSCFEGQCVAWPTISNILPNEGAIGNFVTILGSGFANYDSAVSQVYFSGASGYIEADLGCDAQMSWRGDQIVAQVPVGAVDGPIKVVTKFGAYDDTINNRGWQGNFYINEFLKSPNLCDVSEENCADCLTCRDTSCQTDCDDVNSLDCSACIAQNCNNSCKNDLYKFKSCSKGSVTQLIEVEGQNFGSEKGNKKVYFGQIETGFGAGTATWQDASISGLRIPNLQNGFVDVVIAGEETCLTQSCIATCDPEQDAECSESGQKDCTDNKLSPNCQCRLTEACVDGEDNCVCQKLYSNPYKFQIINPIETPSISSVSPEIAPADQMITLVGLNFGEGVGLVQFIDNESVYNAELTCGGDSWRDNEVVVKIPNQLKINNGTKDVQIKLKTYKGLETEPFDFVINSALAGPGLCSISPNNGPIGTKVNFTGFGFSDLSTNFNIKFGNTVADNFLTWAETKIEKVVVPTGAQTGQVYLQTADGNTTSNSLLYRVGRCSENTCATGETCCDTGICATSCQADYGNVTPTEFGWIVSTGPLPKIPKVLERSCIPAQNISQSPSPYKGEGEACPNGLISATFNLKMDWTTFDQFKTTAGEIIPKIKIKRCLKNNNVDLCDLDNCETDDNCTSVSLPGLLDADKTENNLGLTCLNGTNACVAGSDGCECYLQEPVSMFTLESLNTSQYSGADGVVTLNKAGTKYQLFDDTWYQVEILGGEEYGVKSLVSDPNSYLEKSYALPSTYIWRFRTSNTDCQPTDLIINPAKGLISEVDDIVTYKVCGLSGCQMLDMSSYNWNWGIAKHPEKVEFAGYAQIDGQSRKDYGSYTLNSLAIQDGEVKPEYNLETTRNDLVKIMTSAVIESVSLSKQADLEIQFNEPKVVSYYPVCAEACINSEIGARFNTKMNEIIMESPDTDGTNYKNIKLFSCSTSECLNFDEEINLQSVDYVYGRDNENNIVNDVYLSPLENLLGNTYYRAVIMNDVQSVSGKKLTGLNYIFGSDIVGDCSDKFDNDADDSIDITGGYDINNDLTLDYVCGCYNTDTNIFASYASRASMVECNGENVEFVCRDTTTNNLIKESGDCTDGLDNLGNGEADITGGYEHKSDSDTKLDYVCGCYDPTAQNFAVYGQVDNLRCSEINKEFQLTCLNLSSGQLEVNQDLIDVLPEKYNYFVPARNCNNPTDNESGINLADIYKYTYYKPDAFCNLASDLEAGEAGRLNSFSWIFKTKEGSDECQIDQVKVLPEQYIASEAGKQIKYSSKPYSEPDACSENGQILNPFKYDWYWQSTQDSIAGITNSKFNPNLSSFCSGNCLSKGSLPYGAVCGDDTPDYALGEECDDGNIQNGDGCSSVCLLEPFANCINSEDTSCCGNGIKENNEECDLGCDWKTQNNKECNPRDLTSAQCDDGLDNDGDGLVDMDDPDCTSASASENCSCISKAVSCTSGCLNNGTDTGFVCGNNIVEPGEDRDFADTKPIGLDNNCLNTGASYKLTNGSAPAVCGDGNVETDKGEECEPSLNSNCSAVCLWTGFDQCNLTAKVCNEDTSKDCTQDVVADYDDNGTIDYRCTCSTLKYLVAGNECCGNGIAEGGEECEAVCVNNQGETCSYGSTNCNCQLPDWCTSKCLNKGSNYEYDSYCGDGKTQNGEDVVCETAGGMWGAPYQIATINSNINTVIEQNNGCLMDDSGCLFKFIIDKLYTQGITQIKAYTTEADTSTETLVEANSSNPALMQGDADLIYRTNVCLLPKIAINDATVRPTNEQMDVCRNSLIKLPLNGIVAKDSLNYQNIKLYKILQTGEYCPSPLPSSLMTWNLDENNGTTAYDVKQIADARIFTGIWQPGVSGSSIMLNGSTSYLETQDFELNLDTAWSFSAWLKPKEITGTDDLFKLVAGSETYKISLENNGVVFKHISSIGGASTITKTISAVIPIDEWTNFVFSYDYINNKIIIYINGESSLSLETSIDVRNLFGTIQVDTELETVHLIIGGSDAFDGLVDDIELFDRSLSKEEVYALYSKYSDTVNLTWFENIYQTINKFVRKTTNKLFGWLINDGVAADREDYCPVLIKYDYIEQGNSAVLDILPASIMDQNRQYVLELNNIKNACGKISSDSLTFTTGDEICRVNNVLIEPSLWLDNLGGNQKEYTASARSYAQPIQSFSDVYSWTYNWRIKDASIANVAQQSDLDKALVNTYTKNGKTLVQGIAEITEDKIQEKIDTTGQSIVGNGELEVFICKNPWEDVDGLSTDFIMKPDSNPMIIYENNFGIGLRYCRDFGQQVERTCYNGTSCNVDSDCIGIGDELCDAPLVCPDGETGCQSDLDCIGIGTGVCEELGTHDDLPKLKISKGENFYEDTTEVNQCTDGLDNDGDGLVDEDDYKCQGDDDKWEQPRLLAQYIFSRDIDDNLYDFASDAISLRIYENPESLAPSSWYQKYAPNPGSLTPMQVDCASDDDGEYCYYAGREGSSTYIAGGNMAGNTVYNNIYLLGYNESANEATQNIYSQLLDNITFNLEKDHLEKTYIRKDLKRLEDLSYMYELMDAYKDAHNGEVPQLDSGTYVRNKVFSTWPSWQNEFGKILGASLPLDVYNRFNFFPVQANGTQPCGTDKYCPAGSQCLVEGVSCSSCATDYTQVSGDGLCNGTETCETEPDDCGTCTVEHCGDDVCNNLENCQSCAKDCGNCYDATTCYLKSTDSTLVLDRFKDVYTGQKATNWVYYYKALSDNSFKLEANVEGINGGGNSFYNAINILPKRCSSTGNQCIDTTDCSDCNYIYQ